MAEMLIPLYIAIIGSDHERVKHSIVTYGNQPAVGRGRGHRVCTASHGSRVPLMSQVLSATMGSDCKNGAYCPGLLVMWALP